MGVGEVGIATGCEEVGFGVGCGETGVGVAWAGEARGAVGEVEGAWCVEGPSLLGVALPRTDKTPTSLARLSLVITMPAPKKKS